MKHSELIQRAEKWLRNTAKCCVVLTEASGAGSEIPDVIGWRLGGKTSYTIECKLSRSDFLRDQKKWFRSRENYGVGQYLYYMSLPKIIKTDELPEYWGLLEVQENSVKKIVEAKRRNFSKGTRSFFGEMGILYSELRKIQLIKQGKIKYLEKSRSVNRLLNTFMEMDGSGI